MPQEIYGEQFIFILLFYFTVSRVCMLIGWLSGTHLNTGVERDNTENSFLTKETSVHGTETKP